MKIFSLLETQYNLFLDKTKSYLSKTLSDFGSNYGNNTVFGQLINVLAETVQNIMLYIEDALIEQNKYTAQRKKSIWSLAQVSGYDPSFGKAASAQIELSYIPTNVQELDVIINNKESLTCTQNGLPYCVILPQESVVMSIERDNSSKVFSIVEGKFESQTFTSAGGKLYTQLVNFSGNLDTDYLEVQVNGVLWTKEASLYDMGADGEQYTIKPGLDGKLVIIFGNNEHGRALIEGDVIKVTYLVHDGESGNIDPNEGCDFSFNNQLSTIDGDTVCGDQLFRISLYSKDSVSSGTNSESTETVRNLIGFNSRSLVLADPNNYKNFLNKFSFVGYNRTWSEKGSLIINSLALKNYKNLLSEGKEYFSLSESDFLLSDTQKQSIITCLENTGNQIAGSTYNIFDPDLMKYAMTIYVTLKNSSYDVIYIENKIRNLVGDFFSNVENDRFIPKSDIINLLKNNISELDGVDVYVISEKNEVALINKTYTDTTYKYNPSTGTYDKKTEKVVLIDGENPNLGMDDHGNIVIESDYQYPVLMGGWQYRTDTNSNDLVSVTNPLIIVFE